MSCTTPQRRSSWAVLVGINRYPDPDDNLAGCVRDVEITRTWLLSNLEVPQDHITLLLSEVPDNNAPTYPGVLEPTRENVIREIETVSEKAKAGDLFYFHYSGHGDRVRTKHADKKSGTKKDEVLCTLEEDITDVEFGGLLHDLAETKKLVVCAVLDCCYSGGADRHKTESTGVRCRKQKYDQRLSEGQHARNRSSKDSKSRKIVPKESWFYRPRGYNVIAAAQPYEKAREYSCDGKKYGRMTYHLIQALDTLKASAEPRTHRRSQDSETVTYGQLQEFLEAKCKAVSRQTGKRQQPLHLGDQRRIIFSAVTSDLEPASLTARIIHVGKGRVKLNKGAASSIHKDEEFQIFHPSDILFGDLAAHTPAVAKVKVREVRSLESVAVPCGDPTALEAVKIGWFAKLSKRAKAIKVYIDAPSSVNIRDLIQDCRSQVNDEFPVEFEFDHTRDVDIRLMVDSQSVFHFDDGRQYQLPLFRADHRQGSVELMKLIKHLYSYRVVSQLNHMTGPPPPQYDFKVLPEKDDKKGWQVHFKNNHDAALFVTILDLSPNYGIHQIFPSHSQPTCSKAVPKSEDIPKLVSDIVAPKALRREIPGSSMETIVKVLVTTERANFCHYLLPELDHVDDLGDTGTDIASESSQDDASDIDSEYSSDHSETEERIVNAGRARTTSRSEESSDGIQTDTSGSGSEDTSDDSDIEEGNSRRMVPRDAKACAKWSVAQLPVYTTIPSSPTGQQ